MAEPDESPTVEDAVARQILGHGELKPILPGPGASDYERYLRTDELLALQKTPGEMVHRDERLSPWDYHEVRRALGHGAGFDSPGWNRLRRTAPVLWEAFSELLVRRSVELTDVYIQAAEHPALYDLAEALIEFDERISIWRSVHVKMVQRVIGGGAIGTQGTPVAVLVGMTTKELFPKLWAVGTGPTEIAGS